MPLSYVGRLDRSAVVGAAELVHQLVGRLEVASSWTSESSCTGMTVGALARHLVGQSTYAVTLIRADRTHPSDSPVLTLLGHYEAAPWISEDLDGDSNRFVREKSTAQAAEGPEVAVALQGGAVADLATVLADAPPTTYLPWQGCRLPTDDFLVTRLMEMVVHSDDLAASAGVPTPDFGDAVLEPVLGLLSALAVARHGQDAVVRTLTRPQRAPGSVSAF